MGRTVGGFRIWCKGEMEENAEKRKWRTVKVNEETYILLRRLSALLGMRNYETVFTALLFLYTLLRGDVDEAEAVLKKLKERADRQKWLVENALRTLDEIFKR